MENTVQEAIDTVLNQTFSDFELIISDNASDDGTGEICRAAAKRDSRVIYHRNSNNIVGENFRLTLLLSRGKYFMWAAADDARKPKMLKRCVEALDSDPAAILAYTHTEILDPETGARHPYHDPYPLDQKNPADRYESLVRSLNLGNMIYGLFRRNLLLKLPPLTGKSYNLIAFTDAIFLTNVVLSGKVIQIPEMLFIRRRGRSKPWVDSLALTERVSSPDSDYLSNGVSLPVSESIQEHVRYIMASNLPIKTKLNLAQITYEAYVTRFASNLIFEIDRAVNLAKEGKFMETWNGSPEPHPDETVQNKIDRVYAGLLLDRLERTSIFIKNHQGLHIGKAFCLAKMGRTREAELQIELANQLSPKNAISK
ncbi:MAG: glycosyltransferase family 2 protein [Desulfamplus sp.]|nr:glycosyltransferase family 2 protein [Desulfamplus sp.]